MVYRQHLLVTRYCPMSRQPRVHYSLRNPQRGVYAIMCAILVAVMLGICGLALGLAQMYNRKVEMQGMAAAVALPAARELNGTPEGITAAQLQAGATAARFIYNYKHAFTWTNEAIRFSTTPNPASDTDWVSGNDGTPAAKLFYVKVDTRKLEAGTVSPIFMRIFEQSLPPVEINQRAVAGRTSIRVTPLAICAITEDPAAARGTELVEYGFRRGVGYDLTKLNPFGTAPENFVIDPTVAPGETSTSHFTSATAVGPFVCTGTMWMPRVIGGRIQVSRPFPIDPLYKQLNSRFDDYPGQVCSPNGAPPDINVKSLAGAWMSPKQENAEKVVKQDASMSEAQVTAVGKRLTVADFPSPPAGTTTTSWGPLWSYAKPVKKAAPNTTFDPKTDFPALYQAGLGTSGYPTSTQGGTPYKSSVSSPPANPKLGEENRRVLNIPLLSCPVDSGTDVTATVVAIGKFFMTAPATSDSISAEFAGLVSEQSLAGRVELFP